MEAMLTKFLERGFKTGALEVVYPSGGTRSFGDGEGERVRLRFADRGAMAKLYTDPELQFPELYMDGRLLIEEGDIYDFLVMAKRNKSGDLVTPPAAMRTIGRIADRFWRRRLAPEAAKRNVKHHYDLDGRLFRLFLDQDMQYSCAYFPRGNETLAQAQRLKMRHIAAKMLLDEDMKILDIGSGWGGMAIYLAQTTGARVTGVTLSEEQHRVSRERAQAAGVADRVKFLLQDYREIEGKFDRIVSIGMFEHVGPHHYAEFFRTARRKLRKDGAFLLHSIVRAKPNLYDPPFIQKYIFPDGHIPALSETVTPLERAGLLIKDIEILTGHYAETLRQWRQRFRAERERAVEIYDERFFRMWDLYLAASEVNFRHGKLCNFQIQMTRRQEMGPRERDYVSEAEAWLQAREAKAPATVERKPSAAHEPAE